MAVLSVATSTATIERDKSTGGYKVSKYTSTTPGGSVQFDNATGGPVSIQFAAGTLFGVDSFSLEPGEQREFPIPLEAPIGHYPYAVFCHENGRGQFAVANSMPIIIVDPKR